MKWRLLLLFFCLQAWDVHAQVRDVRGVVLDAGAITLLPGVTISSNTDTVIVTTDKRGNFEIKLPPRNASLQFQFPGYQVVRKTIPPGQRFTTVFLIPDHAESGQDGSHSANGGIMSGMQQDLHIPIAVKAHQDETYEQVSENPFKQTIRTPFSSFTLNADDASFCNVRRFITHKELPPKEAVRIEEMINYLPYRYSIDSVSRTPMTFRTEVTTCPWNSKHWLMRIVTEAGRLPRDTILPNNIVLLIDVSGSMEASNKLPLLKKAFKMLVRQLDSLDKITVIAYSGKASVALPPTRGDQKNKILDVIDNLNAGGSTAGKAGIELAFKLAKENFIPAGNNRVIMATDGDFNVGESSDADMRRLIARYHNWGIFLTCIGVGIGNYKDSKLETLAQWGQGNFIYLDNAAEADRIFSPGEYRKILVTSARNARVKVIFDPVLVKEYRLIGYESRAYGGTDSLTTNLPGGEIGYGQRITAFYELSPVQAKRPPLFLPGTLATVALQYQTVSDDSEHRMIRKVPADVSDFSQSDQRLQFAAAVTLFGMLLRHSAYLGDGSYNMVTKMVRHLKGKAYKEDRKSFLKLVQKTEHLVQQQATPSG